MESCLFFFFFMIHDDVFGDSGDDVYVKVL